MHFNGLPLIILGVYRPYASAVDGFVTEILPILNSDKTRGKFIVIAGDLNFNLLNTNAQSDNFVTLMQTFNFLPLIKKTNSIFFDWSLPLVA